MDPHALLGVAPDADEHEVRRAYRRLVRSLHPDLQPEHLRVDSERRMQLVNSARADVLDQIRRRRPSPGDEPWGSPGPVPRQRRSPEDAERARRWVERQVWLQEQQRIVEEWNQAREARVQQRRRQHEGHHVVRRRTTTMAVTALLMVGALLVGAGLLAVRGASELTAVVAQHGVPTTVVHADLDLRELLTLLARWTS